MVWSMGEVEVMGYVVAMELLDGNLRKVEYVDTTFDPGSIGGSFDTGETKSGRSIKSDFLPTRVIWKGPKARVPDFIHSFGYYFVSDRFKDLVEQFEPGHHQFFPVDMLAKDRSLARKMYIFNICNRLDTVDRKLTTMKMSEGGISWQHWTGTWVFNLGQIGNHHVWIDKHIHQGTYVSDALHDEIADAQITGIGFEKRSSTGDQ